MLEWPSQNRYSAAVKTKLALTGAIVLTLLLFTLILVSVSRLPAELISIRHLNSVQSGRVTMMTFEITNHTADPYIFSPFQVQLRNGNAWTKFEGFDVTAIHPHPTLAPWGVASYSIDVTNLLPGSVVRFSIRPQKILMGLNGFVRRAELNLQRPAGAGPGGRISLNPNDPSSKVFGPPTVVVTAEWVETVSPPGESPNNKSSRAQTGLR